MQELHREKRSHTGEYGCSSMGLTQSHLLQGLWAAVAGARYTGTSEVMLRGLGDKSL